MKNFRRNWKKNPKLKNFLINKEVFFFLKSEPQLVPSWGGWSFRSISWSDFDRPLWISYLTKFRTISGKEQSLRSCPRNEIFPKNFFLFALLISAVIQLDKQNEIVSPDKIQESTNYGNEVPHICLLFLLK